MARVLVFSKCTACSRKQFLSQCLYFSAPANKHRQKKFNTRKVTAVARSVGYLAFGKIKKGTEKLPYGSGPWRVKWPNPGDREIANRAHPGDNVMNTAWEISETV